MSDYFLGEIRLFAGSNAPQNWHICDGTALPVSGNEALFSLIGTTYGGDTQNFRIPDLRGRLPMGQGTGPNLSQRVIGTSLGTETVTLTEANLPTHTHAPKGTTASATTAQANGQLLATTTFAFYADGLPPSGVIKPFAGNAIAQTGASQAHSNIMPCLGLNYIIALQGTYPMKPNN